MKVACLFDNLKVKREGLISLKNNKIRSSILRLNFHNYTLSEKIIERNKTNSLKKKY